jgi:hypothetical protein
LNRKRLLVITISLVAVCAFLLLNTFGIIGIGIAKDFSTIDIGLHSGIQRTEKCCVIQNVNDWMQIWINHTKFRAQYSPFPRPLINFSKMTVIAVFTDRYYSIEIKKILDTGLSIVVEVEGAYSPLRVTTNPYHIVEVDKLNKWVIFKTFSVETS